ncbi:MAG: hypothetical protein GY870_21970 [archaeon]|nr:hypothetical protein [archaeon]
MKWLLILLILFSCNVDRIKNETVPSCCQTLYDILYLTQKAKIEVNTLGLLNCCRKQNKYNFCKDVPKEKYPDCINLMKTF